MFPLASVKNYFEAQRAIIKVQLVISIAQRVHHPCNHLQIHPMNPPPERKTHKNRLRLGPNSFDIPIKRSLLQSLREFHDTLSAECIGRNLDNGTCPLLIQFLSIN